MPKKVMLLLLAVFALAACETSSDIDKAEWDRINAEINRLTMSD